MITSRRAFSAMILSTPRGLPILALTFAGTRNDLMPNLRNLSPSLLGALREAETALQRGAWPQAERAITTALALAPTHPEPKRLLGIFLLRANRPVEAVASFREALTVAPNDIDILIPMAKAQADASDLPGAIASLRAVVAQRADAKTLYVFARLLEQHGELEEALAAMQRVLQLDPTQAQARLQVARNSFYCGKPDDAIAQFRKLIASGQELASAWHGLSEMKTFKFDANDLAAMKALTANEKLVGLERATLLHALGKACEDTGDFASAYAAFVEAAQIEHEKFPWDRAAFANYAAAVRASFSKSAEHRDDQFGNEVLFIIGMPRSGSTLIEQILASHPLVEGGSELPDLDLVLREESMRRRAPFPQWAATATHADWRRLGTDYLSRTARWREKKPRFTDKSPGNWLMAEAALAMLPGARIIDCRRDALETCWSCFKQFFAPGKVAWSSSFDDVATYWRLCTAHGDYLAARYPDRVRIQSYERLVDDPEEQTRELLKFCGLEFDAACLRPQEAIRTIRTASAAQVRKPIARGTSAAERYGAMLDPLRNALNTSE